MRRIGFFIYGITSYLTFLATFLYAIGFVGNHLVPRTIDGEPQVPLATALLVNLGLLGLFAVQHSVMARPAFKRWWTRYVPEVIERSTYVMFSNIALLVLFYFWQPLGGIVWQVTNPVFSTALIALGALGWLIALVSTFLINHFELLGLQQVWHHLLGKSAPKPRFVTPFLYKRVRHPLYLGFMLAFWATPTMTVTHLLFALATAGYVLVAIQLEERDLIDVHGEDYIAYKSEVPMLVPVPGKKADASLVAGANEPIQGVA